MKKFLFVFVVLIFSSLVANAYSVKYMAGAPVGVSFGGGPYRSFAYYNNMSMNHRNLNMNRIQYPPMGMGTRYIYRTPAYRSYYPPYYPQYNYPQNQYPQNIPNNGQTTNTSQTVNRPAEVSRLSKNYNIQPAKKYTRGNVTYYN